MPDAPRQFRPSGQKPAQPRKAWRQTRGTRQERGYDDAWIELRNAYITEHPLCERCEAKGHITPAEQVHHKQAFDGIDDPLRLDWNNLESVCLTCHRARERERRSGRKTTK
jgi:5-methylcytosine-specific restriction protein A